MILIYSVILVSQIFVFFHHYFIFYFLAVWTLDEPLIFLYDSVSHKYGIYPLSSMIDSNIQLEPILDYIIKNRTDIIQYSGDTWSKRLFRPFWELYRTIISMFIEAPFISMLIIGIPASVISIICYCLCCSSSDNSSNKSKNSKKQKRKNGQINEHNDDDEQVLVKMMMKNMKNVLLKLNQNLLKILLNQLMHVIYQHGQ